MQFGTWLRAVRAEETENGVDHYELACHPDKLNTYVHGHLADAIGVLTRVDDRIPDGSTHQELREFWENGRTEYIRDIRSALNYIGAALSAVGCTDKQLDRVSHVEEQEKEESVPSKDFVASDEEDDDAEEDEDEDEDDVETVRIAVADVVGMLGVPAEK